MGSDLLRVEKFLMVFDIEKSGRKISISLRSEAD